MLCASLHLSVCLSIWSAVLRRIKGWEAYFVASSWSSLSSSSGSLTAFGGAAFDDFFGLLPPTYVW
eukprot:m.136354 g.136354  ORF g.136354 m.136354 type:complete len:66 (-) comp52471_c0_seq1:45-242(-)